MALAFVNPDARGQATDYSDLRQQSCVAGSDTISILSGRYAGSFDCVANDPFSNGDDSTLVIAASGGGYWLRDFAHSPADPIQLGWYEQYAQNKNITHWLATMADNFAPFLFVKATTIPGVDTVHMDYIDFQMKSHSAGGKGIHTFHFLEDAGTLVIKGDQLNSPDRHIIWDFHNYNEIVIGGTNLWLIFKGDHPGLGLGANYAGAAPGFINLNQDDGWATATLVDFRANIHDSYRSGVNFVGRKCHLCGNIGRVNQVNIAGEMWNGGIRMNSGAVNVWYDPDNTISRNPYNTNMGWDGTIATGGPYNGVSRVGCNSGVHKESRGRGGAGSAFNVDKVTGGVLLQYGTAGVALFNVDQIGNSEDDPFVIKFKDLGASGPTSRTGLPEGVYVKKTVDYTVLKHDPIADTGPGRRFVKFVQLENEIGADGNGVVSASVPDAACPLSRSSDFVGGFGVFWRAEASRDGVASQYRTSYINVTAERPGGSRVFNDDWLGGSSWGGFHAAGSGADCSPGPAECDRTWGHNVVVAAGQDYASEIKVMDTDSVTGTGKVQAVRVINHGLTDGAGTDYCRDVVIQDVTVKSTISVSSGCDGILARNVKFSGSPRDVMTISSGADVTIPANGRLRAPSGSRITGQGTLVCSGGVQSLPYTFDGTDDTCETTTGEVFNSVNQTVSLDTGWNTVSLAIEPLDNAVDQVVSSISPDLVLVKNWAGDVYYPELSLNTIGTWSSVEGYQVNVDRNSSLAVEGNEEIDRATPIPLRSGWNLVPVYGTSTMPVEDAFASISSELIMAKDNLGRLYYPELGVRTLDTIVPGQGYRVYVRSQISLVYN